MQEGVKKDNAIPWGVQLGGPSANVASYSAEHFRYDEQSSSIKPSNSEKAFNEVERRATFVTYHPLRLVGKVVQFQHRGAYSSSVRAVTCYRLLLERTPTANTRAGQSKRHVPPAPIRRPERLSRLSGQMRFPVTQSHVTTEHERHFIISFGKLYFF